MSTVAELFSALNVARVINGKPVLKSWKESTAKLHAAIQAEQAMHKAEETSIVAKQVEEHKKAVEKIARKANVPAAAVEATVTRLAKELADKRPKATQRVEAARKADAKKAAKKETSPKVKEAVKKLAAKAGKKSTKVEGTVNVSEIAKELGVNPKVARATLRRKNVDRTDAAAIRAALKK